MSQFIESIKLLDGQVYHLKWHQQRVDQTFESMFPNTIGLDLEQIIYQQNLPTQGLFKIKIVYDSNGYKISVESYAKRVINTFELIETNFQYPFKSNERAFINQPLANAIADEVIFCKEGYITDSSYANMVFYDGQQWFTPTTFLLNGTTRQRLLSENKIQEKPIKIEDVSSFIKVGFINALNDLGEQTINLKPL